MKQDNNTTMDHIYHLVKLRNSYETTPFIDIHQTNESLQNQVDFFQSRCEVLEREYVERDLVEGGSGGRKNSSSVSRNEAQLMDKVESLQKEIDERQRLTIELKDQNKVLETSNNELVTRIVSEKEKAIEREERLQEELDGRHSVTHRLQEENDVLKESNREMVTRLVSEKEKMVDEMNRMNEIIETMQKELDMLRALKELRDVEDRAAAAKAKGKKNADDVDVLSGADRSLGGRSGRRWGGDGVVPPSSPQTTVKRAHADEAFAVRYGSDAGADLVATAGSDGTVKLWDASTRDGRPRTTLRGSPGQAVTGVDLARGLAVGCGVDRTCRVWNVASSRMVHHLVGHAHKINCVRLSPDGRSVVTGSADRSVRVWDVARNTYRQTVTMRHSSTSNCLDLSSGDGRTVATGHMDGGLRFWDSRTGERTADAPSVVREGYGVSSVQFDPTSGTRVLCNGKDSVLRIMDVRTFEVVNTFEHPEFRTLSNWSAACFSPDGMYVAAGSSSPGTVFVWRTVDGKLEKKLEGAHSSGVVGIDWCCVGASGQQVSTIDKSGSLVL